MGFLTDIVAQVLRDLEERPRHLDALQADAADAPVVRPFAASLRSHARIAGVAVIAEVKRSSPSAGAIAPATDPVTQATAYAVAGAAAISVLTEAAHFGGSLADMRAVREAVSPPLLRKDFLVDPVQVVEARGAGADAVLLITACLDDRQLAAMIGVARDLGMEPLVETHDDDDLARALATDAEMIGVNARDLETLEVDVDAALERIAGVDRGRVAVLESGVATPAHVRAAVDAGATAILVGEALMRAANPGAMLQTLIHEGSTHDERGHRPTT